MGAVNPNQAGNVNLGVGGGFGGGGFGGMPGAGFGGGQFGNLGAQFGQQGGMGNNRYQNPMLQNLNFDNNNGKLSWNELQDRRNNIKNNEAGQNKQQAAQMIVPVFFRFTSDLRKLQSRKNVGKVIGETGPGQALDVLDQKGPWPQAPHHIGRGGEHVARIVVSRVVAADRERLAGRSARDHVDRPAHGLETDVPDIGGVQRPRRHQGMGAALVLPDRFAGLAIPFDDGEVAETRHGHAHPQPPGTREQFNARQHGSMGSRVWRKGKHTGRGRVQGGSLDFGALPRPTNTLGTRDRPV